MLISTTQSNNQPCLPFKMSCHKTFMKAVYVEKAFGANRDFFWYSTVVGH